MLYQNIEPVPLAPAVETTEAVGTAEPHCELFVAVTAEGRARTATVVGEETTGHPAAVTVAVYVAVAVGLMV